MLSNLENNLKSRDRNLNFNLSDATSMQVLDNQGKENAPRNKYPTSSQQNPEVRSKREYDNYFNTFSNGSNKNQSTKEPREPLKNTTKIAQEESSTSTALKKSQEEQHGES